MPHKKGRARDVVPHLEHRTSRRAERPAHGAAKGAPPLPQRAAAEQWPLPASEGLLPLPLELWLRAVRFGGLAELCRCELLGRAARGVMARHGGAMWEELCEAHFPAMSRSVKAGGPASAPTSPSAPAAVDPEPCGGLADDCPALPEPAVPAVGPLDAPDWKLLYARRWQKQRLWDLNRGRLRSLSDSLTILGTHSKACSACGEAFSSSAGTATTECASHPGEFLPRRSIPGRSFAHLGSLDVSDAWSRAELQQLQAFARAAWRSVGGSAGVRSHARNFRGGGHWAKGLGFKGWGSRGHWAEGLGARPKPGHLRDCIDGKVPCAWSCCGSEELISEGCEVGLHR